MNASGNGSRNVWIVCQHAGSPRHGMNFRPYHIGRELAARGADVTVISGSTSHEYYAPPRTTGKYTFEDVDGLKYVWVRTPKYGESRSLGRVIAWTAYLAGLYGLPKLGLSRPDSILVSSPPPYPVVPMAHIARIFGAKLVFEVRDIWPLSLMNVGGFSSWNPFIRATQWVEDFAYRRADAVVSVLPAAESHMRSRGLASGKYHCVPNGLKVSETRTGISEGTVRKALPGRRFIAGYAGKVGLSYGLGTLVEAAALIRNRSDIGIAVVGAGTDRDELSERALREGLDNIVFLPPVPKNKIPEVLAELDACYLGLRDEPVFRFGVSPTKLFDYMAASKPVIMGIRAGNDPVGEARCGITIPPENPEALASALKKLADSDPGELERMGAAGRSYLEANHDWTVLGLRYAEILGTGIPH